MTEQNPESPAPDAPEAEQEQPQETTQQADATESQEESEQEQSWDQARALEKIRKINSENRALRERATEAEKKNESLPELQQQNSTLGAENLKLKVGYELGLPYGLARRLQGSTREEMVADAESLVSLVSPAAKPAPTSGTPVTALKPGATPENAQTQEDLDYAALFGPTG